MAKPCIASAYPSALHNLNPLGSVVPGAYHGLTDEQQQEGLLYVVFGAVEVVPFVEVRFPKSLSDKRVLLLVHELRQRVGQGAPVTVLAQGVQQDPCQVLGGHLEERERCRLGSDFFSLPACLALCFPTGKSTHCML